MIGAVGIGYNPAAGTWTENGVAPTGPIGAFNLVSLKTETWCGIYNGDIADWNDAEITADNGGTSITGGASQPITVVYRSDGSGSTFLFANAFINQCAATLHPVPAAWQTAPGNTSGVSNNNWFINVNKAGLLPANFSGQPGNNGIRTHVNATPGAVGYLTTDFMKPVDSGGPRSMNLQTWTTHVNKTTPIFKQPNKASATAVMVSAPVPLTTAGSCTTATTYAAGTSPDGKCSHNPINWAPTNPMPTGAAAFPIGGFTMVYAYSCYATAANGGLTTAPRLVAKTKKWGLFSWYFTDPATNLVNQKVVNSLSKNGFGAVPAAWRTGINNLLFTDKKTKIAAPGATGTPCAAIPAVPGKGA
jgi:ABC-type phosphate transport system substrate-binding protein